LGRHDPGRKKRKKAYSGRGQKKNEAHLAMRDDKKDFNIKKKRIMHIPLTAKRNQGPCFKGEKGGKKGLNQPNGCKNSSKRS